jgi:hypothetical protein
MKIFSIGQDCGNESGDRGGGEWGDRVGREERMRL